MARIVSEMKEKKKSARRSDFVSRVGVRWAASVVTSGLAGHRRGNGEAPMQAAERGEFDEKSEEELKSRRVGNAEKRGRRVCFLFCLSLWSGGKLSDVTKMTRMICHGEVGDDICWGGATVATVMPGPAASKYQQY